MSILRDAQHHGALFKIPGLERQVITLSMRNEAICGRYSAQPYMCIRKKTSAANVEGANLVGDGWGVGSHFKAFRGQVPVRAGPLAGQLHAGALVLFYNLAQSKVLQNAVRLSRTV